MYVPTGKLFSDNVDMGMAVVSGIALAVVAACDEDENNSIHSGIVRSESIGSHIGYW